MGFFAVRKTERRDVWTAFAALFILIASHSVLETARDALFLAKVPAARLPWLYLALAALSAAATKIDARAKRGASARRVLSGAAIGASAVTLAFFVLHRALGTAGVYALYLWPGLLTTLLLIHFWEVLGERFTITQAKRLYGFIGAGGVAGAIAGSGVAGLVSRGAGPEALVLLAALGFALAGLVPLLFEEYPPPREAEAAPGMRESLRVVAGDVYARRLVTMLFVATVCLTVSDFVFKSAVARLVPRAELATTLATVYFGINVLSLIAQLWAVAWILKRFSLGAAVGILPALLVVTGLGVAASASLAAVIALRAVDGTLRYSLHRVAGELLFFPFGDDGRRVKVAADLVSQRGGQVLAAIAIISLGALDAPPRFVAGGLVTLAALWLVSALSMRAPYVALFRARLLATRTRPVGDFPELDVASLETLLHTLESDKDREVLAALAILERENKAHVVPALLLHHPSEPVVTRVLGILAHSKRKSALPIIHRIAGHPSAAVRAAVVAARSVLDADAGKLRDLLASEESEEIRGAILVNLIVSGALEPDDRARHTEALLRDGSAATRVAFAEAIGRRAASGFDDVLVRLLAASERDVRRAAANAMANVPPEGVPPGLLSALVHSLADEGTRAAAEHALAVHGEAAFEVMRERLEDPATPLVLRWRIPAAMAAGRPDKAMAALLARLGREPDGGMRFEIVLMLERLVRQNPDLSVDQSALQRAIVATITRAYWCLDMRLQLVRGAPRRSAQRTAGHELLRDLLRDKEANAIGRLFRLLGLLHPSEDLVHVYRSLGVGKAMRATSIELIEGILREPIRSAVLGLVDDCADPLRLERAGTYHRPRRLEYDALLTELENSDSDAVRQVTQFHKAELESRAGDDVRQAVLLPSAGLS